MEKQKSSTVSTLQNYWNIATLTRHFTKEVDASPAMVARLLQDRDGKHIQSGAILCREFVRVREDVPNTRYRFDMRLFRSNSKVFLPAVRVDGEIVYSEGYGKTIVQGDLRLGSANTLVLLALTFMMLLGSLLFLLLLPPSLPSLIAGFAELAIIVYIGLSLRSNYLALKGELFRALSTAGIANEIEEDNSVEAIWVENDELSQSMRR